VSFRAGLTPTFITRSLTSADEASHTSSNITFDIRLCIIFIRPLTFITLSLTSADEASHTSSNITFDIRLCIIFIRPLTFITLSLTSADEASHTSSNITFDIRLFIIVAEIISQYMDMTLQTPVTAATRTIGTGSTNSV
jgi:hypothetical protein